MVIIIINHHHRGNVVIVIALMRRETEEVPGKVGGVSVVGDHDSAAGDGEEASTHVCKRACKKAGQ